MIQLNFHHIITLYFASLMLGIFYAWLVQVLRKRQRIRLAPLTKGTTCEYCHHRFVIDDDKKTYNCPQCHLYNAAMTTHENTLSLKDRKKIKFSD